MLERLGKIDILTLWKVDINIFGLFILAIMMMVVRMMVIITTMIVILVLPKDTSCTAAHSQGTLQAIRRVKI